MLLAPSPHFAEYLAPFPFSSERVGLLWVSPDLTYLVSAGLGATSPTESRQGRSVANGFYSQAIELGTACSSCWGTYMESDLHICYICAGPSV